MNQVTVQPTGGNVLIAPMTDEESVGGIYIPESVREKPQQGFIVALGSGQRSVKGGNLIPWDVKVGDRVLLRKFHGLDVRVGDKVFKMMTADDILAVLVG